jgi:glycosyltransferase involved in cell wall biosynthesis
MPQCEKPKILIIASSYAPSTAVGAKRFTFLSLFFKKKYHEIDILTRKVKYFHSIDYSLPVAGNAYRVGMYPPNFSHPKNIITKILKKIWSDYLCLIDPFSGWILPASIKGVKIVKDNKIDLIIATCPMFSSIVIGFLISRVTKKKLILDYRDPWTTHKRKYCKIFGRKIGRLFEKSAIRYASAIVFCTPFMKNDFIKSIGKCKKFISHVIPSGYNNNDAIQPLYLEKNKKSMVYAGNFYGERRIKILAEPLFRLLNQGFIDKNSFCFHHFGTFNNDEKTIINNYGLQNIIKSHPKVSYEKILRYLKGADILFLPSGSDVRYAIPFKFYDYLSVKRPIFAVAPLNSALAEVMREIDCGRLSQINNYDSITENLRVMLLEEKKYSFSGAEKYTWENAGKMYVDVIEKVHE